MSSLQSQNIENRVVSNVAGTRNNTVTLEVPVKLNPNRPHWIRLIKTTISKTIPNVYANPTTGFDNTTINISNNGGTTWSTIVLQPGIYQVNAIQLAIQQWLIDNAWVAAADPQAIFLAINTALLINYIRLDSTKLILGTQIAIDFGVSDMGTTLGFTSPSSFTTDATYGANANPLLDSQGSVIDVRTSLATGLKSINGVATDVIASVPLTGGTLNEYIYPFDGIRTPKIPFSGGSEIRSFTIDYLGPTGDQIYFLYGNTSTEIEILESL
jgi:hypothetical protein